MKTELGMKEDLSKLLGKALQVKLTLDHEQQYFAYETKLIQFRQAKI